MNSITKSLLAIGVISAALYAADQKDRKTCLDDNGKKTMLRFTDDAGKKHNYTLLEVENKKELLDARNNAGTLPSGEVLVKTSDSTAVSMGVITKKCEKKAKAFASL